LLKIPSISTDRLIRESFTLLTESIVRKALPASEILPLIEGIKCFLGCRENDVVFVNHLFNISPFFKQWIFIIARKISQAD
jgi:hypothetical protein